jgi:transposase
VLHYGLDVHTKYSSYHCLNDAGVVVAEGRVANTREQFAELFSGHPRPCRVAMESCLVWPHVYDLVRDLVDEVQLAHPLAAKLIAWNHVKTDRLDARALAILLRGDLIPRAYLAPRQIRDLRALVRHRLKFVELRSAVRNTTHHVLFRTGHQRPVSDLFGVRGRNWLSQLPLSAVDRNIVSRNLAATDCFNSLIADADRELHDMLLPHPAYAPLRTIPGIGPLIAAICIAEIGDIQRFPSAKQLVAYAGLVPSEYSSGGRVRRGHITKVGSHTLRWAAVEAAFHFARKVPAAETRYTRIRQARGAGVALVATAANVLRVVHGVWKSGRPCQAGLATPASPLVA